MFLGFGTLGVFLFAETVLESALLSQPYVSAASWAGLVRFLGARTIPGEFDAVSIPLVSPLSVAILLYSLFKCCVGAAWIARRRRIRFAEAVILWGDRGWRWWLIPGVWWLLWVLVLLIEGSEGPKSLHFNLGFATISLSTNSALQFLAATSDLCLALCLAGWLATFLTCVSRRTTTDALAPVPSPHPVTPLSTHPRSSRSAHLALGAAILVYTATCSALTAGLWFNLRLPHGDSAMYEEHLWNLEHGKGFRSYLDQGLFLGEHIQVVHVLFLPLHLIWPHHLLLEICESAAVALGAIPVFLLARRHGSSERAALLLAVAYLLYSPLQYLDTTIDLKTFRPSAFGVPAVLWAMERLERGQYWQMALWLLLALSAQEDYAIVVALLGAWILFRPTAVAAPGLHYVSRVLSSKHRRHMLLGAGMGVFGIIYLWLTLNVVLPWFRDGAAIHYVSYFAKIGNTPSEIVINLCTKPHFLFRELLTASAAAYALRLLVPLGFLPLLSPSRLFAGTPLFILLCLNDLAMQPPAPVHHFHAPLVPFLFWSASAALGTNSLLESIQGHGTTRARFACTCALLTGVFMTLTPLGIQFWDPGSPRHWRTLYVPGERARQFAKIEHLVPLSARVASTDFVHPRYTHCERSYDYSKYLRKVADYEDRVPPDTDYILIDVEHPYNTPEEIVALRRDPYAAVRELRREPDQWELLEDETQRYFLVLKRRTP
jgi:uncharacterized membrane protein